jgi:hypothetical protein
LLEQAVVVVVFIRSKCIYWHNKRPSTSRHAHGAADNNRRKRRRRRRGRGKRKWWWWWWWGAVPAHA